MPAHPTHAQERNLARRMVAGVLDALKGSEPPAVVARTLHLKNYRSTTGLTPASVTLGIVELAVFNAHLTADFQEDDLRSRLGTYGSHIAPAMQAGSGLHDVHGWRSAVLNAWKGVIDAEGGFDEVMKKFPSVDEAQVRGMGGRPEFALATRISAIAEIGPQVMKADLGAVR